MTRSVHVPAGIFDSRRYGFAQVAIISTPVGDAVHVSGQVAWDAERNIVGIGDVGRQLRKSLENLAAALASVGVNLDDVGALRLRTVATRDRPCEDFPMKSGDDYDPAVLLDLDYWVLMPI